MTDRETSDRQAWEAEMFRLLAENVTDYAIFVVDPDGRVLSWSRGAEHVLGFTEPEIVGRPCDIFFTPEDVRAGVPRRELDEALRTGRGDDDRWHARKDGSRFWASGTVTPLRDDGGRLRGFAKIMRDRTDLKRAADAARFQARLLDTVGQAVVVTDPEGTIRYWNRHAETLYGWARAEAVGRNVLDTVVPDGGAGQAAEVMARLRAGESWSGEFLVRRRDGTTFPACVTDSPVLDADGRLEAVIGVSADISDRRRAEEAVGQSEERFRGLMEQAPFSVQIFAPDGRTLRVNRAWEELWGVTLDQVADYNVLEDPQLEAKGVLPLIRRAFAGEPIAIPAIRYDPNETVPGRTRHRDPLRWVAAVAYPLRDDAGRVREVVLVHDDITDRTRAEEALRASERVYRAIGESIDYGVWVCDPDGRNTYVSESFLRLVGLTQEEHSAFGWADVLHPDDADRTVAAWKDCVRSGGAWDVEHRVRGVDGRWHSVLARGVPVRDELGKITAWAGINLDISRLKRVEDELREADRRKDEFLATLAHELRNPLAPVRNSLQILKMPRVDAETVARSREMMERQVEHLVRLVDDLLDVSRVMRGKIELRPELVELAAVVGRAVETARPVIDAQGHKLTIAVPDESLPVWADPVRLAQVFGNLLTNAAKYTDPGGRIDLTARQEGDEAVVRVRDTGIGIAPDLLPKVFDLFMQADHAAARSQGGLGIGLTLVRNLVEMHHGTVEARSGGPGRGSEFVVRLPLSDREGSGRDRREVGDEHQSPPPPGQRLLVVDDNRDAAESLAALLRLQGHEVRVARDGPSALEAVRGYRPAAVFLDIGMPGMDGYEVARQLRRQPDLEGVKLVALTGWGQEEDRRRSREAGFDRHLVKPADPAVLYALLAELRSEPK